MKISFVFFSVLILTFQASALEIIGLNISRDVSSLTGLSIDSYSRQCKEYGNYSGHNQSIWNDTKDRMKSIALNALGAEPDDKETYNRFLIFLRKSSEQNAALLRNIAQPQTYPFSELYPSYDCSLKPIKGDSYLEPSKFGTLNGLLDKMGGGIRELELVHSSMGEIIQAYIVKDFERKDSDELDVSSEALVNSIMQKLGEKAESRLEDERSSDMIAYRKHIAWNNKYSCRITTAFANVNLSVYRTDKIKVTLECKNNVVDLKRSKDHLLASDIFTKDFHKFELELQRAAKEYLDEKKADQYRASKLAL